MNGTNTIEFRNITKYFPGVKALDNISFKAESGEVLALIGENGAGKSTLLKIMNGDYRATSGEYLLNGEVKNYNSPKEAIDDGISMIYQERQVLPELSVSENVFLGEWPCKKNGLIDYRKMHKETQKIIDEFDLEIDPEQKVKELSTAYQQMVEIMKAYRRDLKVIAFDEPTASLSDSEIDKLFKIIYKLKEQNKIIIYISHRMNEIDLIADKIAVLKDGSLVAVKDKGEVNNKELIKLMVGRDLGDIFESVRKEKVIGDTLLKVDNISSYYFKDISFELKRGEILGFAGLVGAGRTEVMRGIFGADEILSGKVYIDNNEVNIDSPSEAIEKGIVLCPEDRKTQGIIPNMGVGHNISLSMFKRIANKLGFIDIKKEKDIIEEGISSLNIKTPDEHKKIVELSGGNQQKAIIARWLATDPKILILDEPTKGIDIGAKNEFYRLINECAQKGMGVIIVSSELPEIIGLSDNIIVMRNGRISGKISRENATEEKILSLAMLEEEEKY